MGGLDGRASVLVVDDDEVCRLIVQRLLERAGHEVVLVNDSRAVFTQLETGAHALVLMEYRLPDLDGVTVTRIIRGSVTSRFDSKIPIVGMTAPHGASDRKVCLAAGMNDFVAKPVVAEALLTAVRNNLRPGLVASAGIPPGQSAADRLAETMADRFMELLPQEIRLLKSALLDRDLEALRAFGHRLRGSADIIGAGSLSRTAMALEMAARRGDATTALSEGEALFEALQRMADT